MAKYRVEKQVFVFASEMYLYGDVIELADGVKVPHGLELLEEPTPVKQEVKAPKRKGKRTADSDPF